MKKIRKFKISAHYRELHRRLKKSAIDLNLPASKDKNHFTEFVSSLMCSIEPSVLYKTLGDKDISTIAALTLGSNLEDKINSFLSDEEKKAACICAIEFLDTAFDFALNLVKEEAKKENSDTMPAKIFLFPLEADLGASSTLTARFIRKNEIANEREKTEILPKIIEKLDTSKISMSFIQGKILPHYSVVFSVDWVHKKRKR